MDSVRKITWYQLVTLSAVLIISLLLFSTVFQAQAANFDLTGSCLGGVGDVPALIAAINAANANGEADTITVAAGCVYTLNAIDNVTGGNNGLPSITSPIVIEGNGATIRRDLSAQDEFRLFHVADTGALTLDNLTVENGAVDEGGWSCPENCGGGIYAGGALTLTKTTLRHNRAAWDGGGLYGIDSTLLITASTIFSNTASEGGGILLAIEGGDLTAVVENSQIVSNTSELDGGGIFIYGVGDYALTLALNRSAVNFNQTTINGFGGGIGMWANVGDITLNIDDSAIDWNIASRGGGGIQYSSYGAQVSVNLNRSTVNWNQALDEWDGGGGIASTSDGEASMQLNLIDSTVNGNQTGGQGGGIANTMGQMTLTGSTVSNNQANQNGGGIYNAGALSLVNCTVSDNQTAGDGGGLLNYDVLHLTHVTVAGNTADSDGDDAGDGGGLFQGWTATLTNTILSNNVDDSPTGDVFTDCYQTSWEGEVTNSGGYNLVQNVPGCTGIFTATGDITGSDPLLGPLDDNGGPTWTRALLAGSPARDIVPNGINGCGITITVDQRGTARPFPAGGACDTGAYEALITHIITPTAGAGGSITPGTPQTVLHGDDITFSIAANAGYHIVDVGVDGVSQGVLTSYAFLNVTADHTISATFAINTYVITPTAGAGGSLTPGTPQTVNHGDDITFTVAADAGYHVVDVGVDGVSQGALASYAFLNVTADHTISATFALDEVVERYFVYLPLVLRQQLPDLIVRSITVSPTGLLVGQPATITVVIENTGSFTTTAGFWVDLYIDPDPALMPPQVNQTWDLVGSQYGLAWGVTQSLAPGEQVTLTSLSYVAEYSDWPGYFNCNGPHTLYAQVDSYSGLTTYGAIAEADETNNVYGPVEVTVVCPEWLHSACLISSPARSDKAYPPRP